ncbi:MULTISPECIES: hypothetical protein [Brevibacillus]|uniref:hypothetical protein n=1 Tax=Brevibacillus TaxID=55080 RepID=UPI0012FE2E3F|nr:MULTISPECIES: hypothetical protein [Brevibacillus]MBY0050135.1 hypothetical protein [Brevibacillus agri]MCG5253830.1 hypothetical protein [Brevibacillus agri]QHZ56633.1 hypothetical protein M655_013785 [Brevibacillus sp. NSP2.1]
MLKRLMQEIIELLRADIPGMAEAFHPRHGEGEKLQRPTGRRPAFLELWPERHHPFSRRDPQAKAACLSADARRYGCPRSASVAP